MEDIIRIDSKVIPGHFILHECQARLVDCVAIAKERSQLSSLEDVFTSAGRWTLGELHNGNVSYVHLYNDFMAHSFYFIESDVPTEEHNERGKWIMNGGIIYHGSGQYGGWQIHT